jgi:predicted CoA-binding protein
VYAVNPNAEVVEGDRAYPDLRSIPGRLEAVIIGTRPELADATMRECVDLGSTTSGCTRGPGGGSVSETAAAEGREHGITVLVGGCPCMFGPTADAGHKAMRLVFTLTGHVPKRI